MPFDDFLTDRQADTRSGIFSARVESLEDDENAIGKLRVDADAVVANFDLPFSADVFGSDVHDRRLVTVEFDRVADEVLKQLRELGGVAHDDRQFIKNYLAAVFGDSGLQVVDGLGDDFPAVGDFEFLAKISVLNYSR